MTWRLLRTTGSLALALCLSACGGGGGSGGGAGGVNSTPPPPPAPPPPPPPPVPGGITLIPGVSGDTVFAGKGATGIGPAGLADAQQPVIRYSAASATYTITFPDRPAETLVDDPSVTGDGGANLRFGGGFAAAYAATDGLSYSNLIGYSDASNGLGLLLGYLAFGLATPPGAVPVTGSARYSARVMGNSNETYFDNLAGDLLFNGIQGNMALAFNFGAGTLSGSLTAFLDVPYQTPLGTFSFVDTVYSTGSPTFSGAFATAVPGINSFSGLFTGPAGQELIGNFALPYVSPNDGKTYQSSGAFVGKKTSTP